MDISTNDAREQGSPETGDSNWNGDSAVQRLKKLDIR
jgi:hypothetical protein